MKKILLIILDGWGIRNDKKYNAIKIANTPNFDSALKNYPNTSLRASGKAVGLPEGTLGGSEVGHLHIGSGRIIKQQLTKINESIENGSFFEKEDLVEAIKNCKQKKSTLHVMGLLSDAGVHSNIKHLFAIIKTAKKYGLEDLRIHCFLDGRDTPPKSARKYLDLLEKKIKKIGIGEISTISGRYYSMDRDKRWDRTQKVFDVIVSGKGIKSESPKKALEKAYERGETDEFVKPTIIKNYNGMKKEDYILSFNFRADRMKQLTKLLLDFNKNMISMTEYSEKLNTKELFHPIVVENSLGEIISENNLKQLRIAESEKGPHVTYFFNGQREEKFENEERIILPSPKVATYDMKPEMSAKKITKKLLKNFEDYDFILLNFANGDMVGHTGDLDASVKGVETVDECLGEIIEKNKKRFTIIITADHGNCEDMRDKTKTAHTTNKVPFILVDEDLKDKKLKEGCGLYNIAPTVLKIMKIKKPETMSDPLF